MQNLLPQTGKEKTLVPYATASAILPDGASVEMVYDPRTRQSRLILWRDGEWSSVSEIPTGDGHRLVPYSPTNNLISNDVVLFPSEPTEFGSERDLLAAIQDFVHRYVDLSPLYEKIATYYVVLTWLYDAFNELPYLRARGDLGSGKTRFLRVIGSICYRPIFAGTATISPIFRILDSIRGTLVIDEGDFRLSDEKAEITKILNNGNQKGFPVLRTEVINKREFDPRAYSVFGPKLIATRGFFDDRALESRCLTEEMGQRRLRTDIPITLPATFRDEALALRNKLLLFRFRNFPPRAIDETLIDRTLEPRLNQVFAPLLSVVTDEATRNEVRELARTYNGELIAERGMDMEAQVLEVIALLLAAGNARPSMKDITQHFVERFGDEYEKAVTPKWIGYILRKKLHLKPAKSHGVFGLPPTEQGKLDRLFEKYGIAVPSEPPSDESRVDVGDVGDVIQGNTDATHS